MAFPTIVLGIDLSLTGLGMVAVPVDWALDWQRVQRITIGMNLPKGASLRESTLRRASLANDVARWASRRNVTHAFVEGYPMGGRLFNLDKLAELGGVVRDRLAELDLFPRPVAEMTGRKLLLGRVPTRDRKAAVVSALQQCGADFDDADQADAFVAANYGLSELGAPFVTIWTPELETQAQAAKRTQRRKPRRAPEECIK